MDKQSIASGESPKVYKAESEVDEEPEIEEEVAVKEEIESEKSEPEKLSPSSSKSSVGDQPSGDVEEEATGVPEEPKVASPALRAVLQQAKVTFCRKFSFFWP